MIENNRFGAVGLVVVMSKVISVETQIFCLRSMRLVMVFGQFIDQKGNGGAAL